MNQNLRRLLITGGVVGTLWCVPNVHARRELLLDVTHGQQPTDSGSDQVFYSLAECKELGGQALKVQYPEGDSFGARVGKVTDWKSFSNLEFSVFNPSSERVTLALNIKHQQSTSYSTRVDLPIAIRPGRHDLKLSIASMVNSDGSAPNLASVTRWYLANTTGKPVTLYFSDISLVGDEPPAPAVATAAPLPISGTLTGTGLVPSGVVYHIHGSIGGQPVNLTLTPESTAPTEPMQSSLQTTPPPPATTFSRPSGSPRVRATPMPEIHAPVLFNTPAADAILSALDVYPPDNPWNQVVTDWPVHPNSRNIIASIGPDRPLRYNPDMAFVLVPPDQKRVPVQIPDPSESDKGPFPVAENTPIEGWPSYYRSEPRFSGLSLDDVQRDKLNVHGDRHAIIVDPVNRLLYEFWQFKKTDQGWQAEQASTFDLKTNRLRPDGWTSADAAGLPIFPATVRYDELKRGSIEHALRVTVSKTRRAYVAPATHYASKLTDENLPRMGERLRLRRDFDSRGFSPEVQIILKALQTYGMFVADNGIDWAISVTPDERIPGLHEELRRIRGASFEVVVPPQP